MHIYVKMHMHMRTYAAPDLLGDARAHVDVDKDPASRALAIGWMCTGLGLAKVMFSVKPVSKGEGLSSILWRQC